MSVVAGYKKIFHLIKKHWLTIGFVLGFFSDLMLLNRIDDTFDNFVLLFYTTLASVSLLVFYVGVAEKTTEWLSKKIKIYAPVLMQYSFGGLLSGMLIFYGRSGDWLSSWPFLLLILSVIVGNELVEKRSDRLVYQLSLYFMGLLSFTVLEVPVLTGKMGDGIFVLSGLIALLLIAVMVKLLRLVVPHFVALHIRPIILAIGGIYVSFNTLYFLNLIPPIPLSLTELQIVQSVVRLESGYRVETEEQAWYTFIPFVYDVIHPKRDSIGCFARVFTPTKLSTKIYHQWDYLDKDNEWKEHVRIGYDIAGVNSQGYGGYTLVSGFHAGVWRCRVETERGQLLGQETVRIDMVGEARKIVTKIE